MSKPEKGIIVHLWIIEKVQICLLSTRIDFFVYLNEPWYGNNVYTREHIIFFCVKMFHLRHKYYSIVFLAAVGQPLLEDINDICNAQLGSCGGSANKCRSKI